MYFTMRNVDQSDGKHLYNAAWMATGSRLQSLTVVALVVTYTGTHVCMRDLCAAMVVLIP